MAPVTQIFPYCMNDTKLTTNTTVQTDWQRQVTVVEQARIRQLVLVPVLVSAGTELILFLVAGTVLWFGFSVRILLITH